MILTGDSREILPRLEPETIDCIITSPPYYQLRDYNVSGQIGTEQTPEDYITTLTAIFAAAKTLLKPRGTLWINIGDTYKNKNLLGIPWKLAFALQNNGWILRQDIIWAKPNPMPESVCNRCTKSHEYLFLLSKSPDYYFDMDGIKEKARYQKENSFNTGSQCRYGGKKYSEHPDQFYRTKSGNSYTYTGTRHPRSVWSIPTQPFPGDHFATFPEELVRRCILAGCPPDGLVLDPFCGSGTTGKVAHDLGRRFCGIELNAEYVQMAEKRIGSSRQSLLGVMDM